jgi:hypothetical protein
MPEQARSVLASMKSNLESRSTGRTAAIQGVQTEEHEFVLTIDLPLPGGPAAGSPFMKMVMQVWTAQPEEAQRVAALRELKNYRTSAGSALNPAEMIKEVLNGLPGMGDNLSTMIAEMSKDGGVSMRMHVELFAPVLALLSQQLPQPPGQAPGPALDPNAALMQINQEVVELSTGPLDDALFEVPADYQPASLEEILKEAVPPPTTPRFPQ